MIHTRASLVMLVVVAASFRCAKATGTTGGTKPRPAQAGDSNSMTGGQTGATDAAAPPASDLDASEADEAEDPNDDVDADEKSDFRQHYEVGGIMYPDGPPKPAAESDVHNCEVLTMAPTPIAGLADFSYSAPAIAVDHAYRIQMPGKSAAHVSLTVPTDGNYFIYATTATSLSVFQIDGLILPEKRQQSDIPGCPKVQARHSFVMTTGQYILRWGPEPTGMVDVIVAAGTP